MLAYDWRLTLADNDLRKVGTMCSAFGVRVSYPMLDPRVVDVSLRVPPAMKMRGKELRSFYKHAMRDFLPREILEKTKHGMGLPFGEWLRRDARLAALIESALADLKSRRIVRAEFLDGLIRLHREGGGGDATDSGYPIWVLAMLEMWLQAHAPRFAKR
jgi:asparagine synthase (glutamine-hydrolysing)